MRNLSVNISASTVAWYGAIVATTGFIVSTYNVFRDRAKIRVEYGVGYKLLDELDPEKEKIDYFKTTVINRGRRPVVITHVGAKFHKEKKTVLFNASFHKQNEERILTETNPVTIYLTEQKDLKLDKLWYVFAIEARGKEYRKFSDTYGRLKFWVFQPFQKILKVWRKK